MRAQEPLGGPAGEYIEVLAVRAVAGGRARGPWLALGAAHLLTVVWLFSGALFGGRLLFFRDLSLQYAPDYAVAAEALRTGTWPLWNPFANAGEPFLLAYPVDLVLLLVGGWHAPLGVGAALHLLLALAGASWLASRLGMGPWGSWLTGAAYGLGGLLLSTVNLLQIYEAAAWAPVVLGAGLVAVRQPTGRRWAALAALVAVQSSTLAAEVVLQTALAGLALVGFRTLANRRRLLGLGGAAVVSLALAAPALLGVGALLRGTARARGFPTAEALAYSLHPAVLAEAVVPRLTGDPHAFSDAGFWGRRYFPDGYPYFLTLYMGVGVLLLASHARERRALVALGLLGLLLAAGEYGPLALIPEGWTLPLRGPQKLFFLTHLSVALLAGFGLERALRTGAPGRRSLLLLLPGLLLLALGALASFAPAAAHAVADRLLAVRLDARDFAAVRHVWASSWVPAGALALGAGLALLRGGRLLPLAAVLAVADLLATNGAVNALAPSRFYDLRDDVAGIVEPAAERGRFRWYSFGVAHTPGLRFEPAMAAAASDVWLYYLDRQTLLYRTPALDGLEAALDVDRTGWAPSGSTVAVSDARPDRYRALHPRLRLANVRWVLSFAPLPEDLVVRRASVKLPEVVPPLGLYELRDPLPRAFWVPEGSGKDAAEAGPPGEASRRAGEDGGAPSLPRVRYEPIDVHTVRIEADTPPGMIVVLDGEDSGWEAENRSVRVPLRRALGRYRAVPTPGGAQVITLHYRPRWRPVALGLCALGLVGLVALARERGVSTLTRGGTARAILPPEVTESVSQSDTATRGDGLTPSRPTR